MQLFRKQALDHQNRLHGEIFLVPPLRWQAIGILLLLLILGCAALLALGTYSQTVTAIGTLRNSPGPHTVAPSESGSQSEIQMQDAWIAVLPLSLAEADKIAPGQAASLTIEGYSLTGFGALSGSVAGVGGVVVSDDTPIRTIRVAIPTSALREISPRLHEGIKAEVSIKVGEQPLWRWLFKPILPHPSQ